MGAERSASRTTVQTRPKAFFSDDGYYINGAIKGTYTVKMDQLVDKLTAYGFDVRVQIPRKEEGDAGPTEPREPCFNSFVFPILVSSPPPR